jgi:hypothetical protein
MPDFGSDLSALPDVDPTFTVATGSSVLAEAIARRLQTPRGALFYAPGYGLDVREALNEAWEPRALERWRAAIERECEADERVERATASLGFDPPRQTLRLSIRIDSAQGPFKLVLGITALRVDLLTVE